GEYLGLGAAAHSFINGQRIANRDSLDDYLSALAVGELPRCEVENIDLPTALSEAIILGLRLNDGVYLDDIERQFSIDLLSRFKIEIAELSSLGLIIIENRNLKLTARGRLMGNEVFIRFLPS
ncbi:MAG: coproporphyrinogen III oxidase family protein, partial [Dehalococcoidia bacterium]